MKDADSRLTVSVCLQPLLRHLPRKLPNLVNYAAVRAITPFKVIQGHRNASFAKSSWCDFNCQWWVALIHLTSNHLFVRFGGNAGVSSLWHFIWSDVVLYYYCSSSTVVVVVVLLPLLLQYQHTVQSFWRTETWSALETFANSTAAMTGDAWHQCVKHLRTGNALFWCDCAARNVSDRARYTQQQCADCLTAVFRRNF